MALQNAFCSLEELKQRVGIDDNSLDDVLQGCINETAAAMEAWIGRPIIRHHARREFFTGGRSAILAGMTNIAQIHSIRESATRDFDTEGAYTELVENEDYVLDDSVGPTGGQRGQSGWIRRIGGNWMGSARQPNQVRMIYTAGFKSPSESAMENSTITLQSAGEVADFTLKKQLSGSLGLIHTIEEDQDSNISTRALVANTTTYGVLRFDILGRMLPTWSVVSLQLAWKAKLAIAGQTSTYPLKLIQENDPLSSDLAALFSEITDAEELQDNASPSTDASYDSFSYTMLSDAHRALLLSAIQRGWLGFGFVADTTGRLLIASYENTTPTDKPVLTVRHTALPGDLWVSPADLRHANLVQSIHAYQTRRTPGIISEALRGTGLSAGNSTYKYPYELLPYVTNVLMNYRR